MSTNVELLADHRYRVASYGIAAAYAGCLLQQLGAKIEHETVLDLESIGAFVAEGAIKNLQPTLEANDGDVLITDVPFSKESRATLNELALSARVIWITPWGLREPWATRPATDLTLYGAAGWMSSVGDPDREPLAPPGAQCQMIASQYAVIAALAHFVQGDSVQPKVGLVEISLFEVLVASLIYTPVSHQYHGKIAKRAGKRYATSVPTVVTLPCKDGYVGVHAPLQRQWDSLCRLIGQPQLATDPRFLTAAAREQNLEALDHYLCAWLATRSRFDIYHELQRARVPASAHPNTAEVLASPQLAARGYWRTVTTPSARKLQVPGPPVRVRTVSRCSASTAENNANAHVNARVNARSDERCWKSNRLRVVDLSMGWAGPLATQMLAAYGADVIKIEGPEHSDWWRAFAVQTANPSAPAHELSPTFNTVNRGKRGIVLDFSAPEQMATVRRLIASADVVVENFGPGVLEKLGLTYDTLMPTNPLLIMLRLPGMGSDGPEGNYRTFGNTIEGMSGLSALVGYPDGPPLLLPNAFGDPVAGLSGAIAVLAALAKARQDGCGRLLECSQLEGFIPFISEALIDYQLTGEIPPRRGNRRVNSIVSDAIPCRGDDVWAAIEITNETQWQRLAILINQQWAHTAKVHTREDQRNLLEQLKSWSKNCERDAVINMCLQAGVAAAPVLNEADVLSVEPLVSANFWLTENRKHSGTHRYPALPIVEQGVRPTLSSPAPLMGEHNSEVLGA